MKATRYSFAVCYILLGAALVVPARAQLYWDTNGAVTGAGSTTPAGTWGIDDFWNLTSDGTGTTGAWTNGSVAVFSAGTDATGTYTVTVSGTQTISGLTVLNGTPTFSGGSLSFSSPTDFNITGNATIASVLTGSDGGRLDKSGSGTLILTGANTYAGDSATNLGTWVSFGTLEVKGGSISHPTTTISVGLHGGENGTFKVTNGGSASTSSGFIGQDAGSVGSITVDGSGSTWTTGSEGALFIGYIGTGTLNISNGGSVTANGGTFVGGADFASPSTGTLNITSGGTLTSGDGLIGNASGSASVGIVTVDGSGSSWTITPSDLEVGLGLGSTGILNITNGGSVSSAGSSMGIGDNGSTGAVIVDGAGSSLSVAGDLSIANSTGSLGALTLTRGGTFNANGGAGTIYLTEGVGATGTLNIGAAATGTAAAGGIVNAGIITTGTVEYGAGTGTLQFKTNATSGSPYYFTKDGTSSGPVITITGPTNITNTAGYNVLFSINSYTGNTTINGGTLALGSAGAISSDSEIILGGGTLALRSFSPATFTTALAVTGNSFIDFGSGNKTLVFTDSSANAWLGSVTLSNFAVGADEFGFSSASGLTGSQLAQIFLPGYTATGLDVSGFVQFTAIPEPATYALMSAGLGVLIVSVRRRA